MKHLFQTQSQNPNIFDTKFIEKTSKKNREEMEFTGKGSTANKNKAMRNIFQEKGEKGKKGRNRKDINSVPYDRSKQFKNNDLLRKFRSVIVVPIAIAAASVISSCKKDDPKPIVPAAKLINTPPQIENVNSENLSLSFFEGLAAGTKIAEYTLEDKENHPIIAEISNVSGRIQVKQVGNKIEIITEKKFLQADVGKKLSATITLKDEITGQYDASKNKTYQFTATIKDDAENGIKITPSFNLVAEENDPSQKLLATIENAISVEITTIKDKNGADISNKISKAGFEITTVGNEIMLKTPANINFEDLNATAGIQPDEEIKITTEIKGINGTQESREISFKIKDLNDEKTSIPNDTTGYRSPTTITDTNGVEHHAYLGETINKDRKVDELNDTTATETTVIHPDLQITKAKFDRLSTREHAQFGADFLNQILGNPWMKEHFEVMYEPGGVPGLRQKANSTENLVTISNQVFLFYNGGGIPDGHYLSNRFISRLGEACQDFFEVITPELMPGGSSAAFSVTDNDISNNTLNQGFAKFSGDIIGKVLRGEMNYWQAADYLASLTAEYAAGKTGRDSNGTSAGYAYGDWPPRP